MCRDAVHTCIRQVSRDFGGGLGPEHFVQLLSVQGLLSQMSKQEWLGVSRALCPQQHLGTITTCSYSTLLLTQGSPCSRLGGASPVSELWWACGLTILLQKHL